MTTEILSVTIENYGTPVIGQYAEIKNLQIIFTIRYKD